MQNNCDNSDFYKKGSIKMVDKFKDTIYNETTVIAANAKEVI